MAGQWLTEGAVNPDLGVSELLNGAFRPKDVALDNKDINDSYELSRANLVAPMAQSGSLDQLLAISKELKDTKYAYDFFSKLPTYGMIGTTTFTPDE